MAEQLGLDPGFLIPRATLEEIGKARPATLEALEQVPGVRRWQVEAVGDAMLATLREEVAAVRKCGSARVRE